MLTTTYNDVQNLAAELAGRPRDKLPVADATILRASFASELPEIWNRDAWPELCDHLESVALDANNAFSLREGDADEMGDILAVIEGGNPLTTTAVRKVESFTRLNNRVVVVGTESTVYVDWQTPCPDLLAAAYDSGTATLPRRFKLALAARGAAQLVLQDDPGLSGVLKGMAEADLSRQAARIRKPWWRA